MSAQTNRDVSTPQAEDDHISVVTTPVTLDGYCAECGDSLRVPNKGLGRASLASWRTRHQHVTSTGLTSDQDASAPQAENSEARRCQFCDETVVLERTDDPWFHLDTGDEQCEGMDEFASPANANPTEKA